MTVVSFTGYQPPPRYDAQPWVQARIEEAVAATGPWTVIDTKALILDVDPANPAVQSFTTELATLDAGWYRVVWLDAQGDTSAPTEPMPNVVGGGAVPTVDEVAALLQERTWVDGVQVGTFRNDSTPEARDGTNPTADQAQRLIDLAVDEVLSIFGGVIPVGYERRARMLATFDAAMLIEDSFFRRDVEAGTSPYAQYAAKFLSLKERLGDDPNVVTGASGFASVPLRSPYVPVVPVVP